LHRAFLRRKSIFEPETAFANNNYTLLAYYSFRLSFFPGREIFNAAMPRFKFNNQPYDYYSRKPPEKMISV